MLFHVPFFLVVPVVKWDAPIFKIFHVVPVVTTGLGCTGLYWAVLGYAALSA